MKEKTIVECIIEIGQVVSEIPKNTVKGIGLTVGVIVTAPFEVLEFIQDSAQLLPTKKEALSLKDFSFDELCEACDDLGITTDIKDIVKSPYHSTRDGLFDFVESWKSTEEDIRKKYVK